MVGTYFVYLIILCCGPLCIRYIIGRSRNVSSKQWIKLYLVFILLSLIIGGRYEVGTDFPNYVEYYKSYLLGNSNIADVIVLGNGLEPGYLFINWMSSQLGMSVSMFFTFIAFVSFILLFKSQCNHPYLWPWILFFFYVQMFGISVNLVRQACAIFLFFYAIRFIGKDRLKLSLIITGCVLLHYSSIVFYIALFIDLKCFKVLDNKKLLLLVFVMTWTCSSYLLPKFISIIPLDLLSAKYLQNLENADIEMAVSSGFGVLATKLIDIILILQSEKVLVYYRDERLRLIYRLFFVGIIISNVMGISMFLSRIFLGLVMLRIYILSYTMYYNFKCKDYRLLLAIFVVMLCTLQFIMSIRNNASGITPYQFMWQ